jgi:hypothetical protein
MITWAAIMTLAMSALVYASDASSMLIELAELGGVIALFTLVCAAEAFSEPKS